MAILDIVYFGDPRLEKVSEPISEVTPEIRKLARDMFETMYYTSGVGLSAPQVGINKRLLVTDVSGGDDRTKQLTVINPIVIESSGSQTGREGCLSFPSLFATVTRANFVRIKGLNLEGKEVEVEGTELLARALLHEIDHLDGILFIQRMKKADREVIVRKMKKIRTQIEKGEKVFALSE
jgi:peptide deformylase